MISLPCDPKENQYEDAIASYVRSLGYFTESRIVLRNNGREVLELDLVATPPISHSCNSILIEAKSGSTGFGDLFKVYGWKEFLKIPNGMIVRKSLIPKGDIQTYLELEKKLDVAVRVIDFDEYEQAQYVIPKCINSEVRESQSVFCTGWFAANLERICIEQLNHELKNNADEELLISIKSYNQALMGSFFINDSATRANTIYQSYSKHHKLTEKCIKYIAHKESIGEQQAFNKLADTNEYPWIQYVSIQEHRARILIIKNAVELSFMPGDKTLEQRLKLLFSPHNFQKAIASISDLPYKNSIPYFFHIFIEIFGGFYIEDTKDKEYLASLTGIPVERVEETLFILNDFFPIENGWFYNIKDKIHVLKLMPSLWRGVGCFFRYYLYEIKEYSEICKDMSWLLNKYHNNLYRTLEPKLKKIPE